MPVAKTACLLNKSAFVCALGSNVGCKCRVRIACDTEHGTGSLSIRYEADLSGLPKPHRRPLTLLFRPQNIDSCILTSESNNTLIRPDHFRFIPSTSVTNAADVLTLTFALKEPGAILYPKQLTSLRSINFEDTNFRAFSTICRSCTIHIHFAKAAFGIGNPSRTNEGVQLQNFVDSLKVGLLPEDIFLNRLDSGRGVKEGTWRLFDISATSPSDLPKYPTHDNPLGLARKRSRRVSPSNYSEKRPYKYTTPPPYSPTEANTPTPGTISTITDDAKSSNIQQTDFTRPPPYLHVRPAFAADLKQNIDPQVILLANMLRGVQGHVLQDALMLSGHENLLHPSLVPIHGDSEKSILVIDKSADKNTPTDDRQETWLEKFVDARFKGCTDTRLAPLVKNMFTSAVDIRLKEYIDANLSSHVKEALDEAMAEHQNQLYTDCRDAEVGIQEVVDDALIEMKMALEDNLKEIQALAEDHLHKMTEESETLLDKADTSENELDCIRSRLIKLVESILPRHERFAQKIETGALRGRSV